MPNKVDNPLVFNMNVSIIIPALNEEKFIPNLLSNLAKQTSKDFEVIVVDGNSEDNTFNTAKKFSSKIVSLSVHRVNKRNVSFQRNLGAEKARGEYLLFIDADTEMNDEYLSLLAKKIEDANFPDMFSSCFYPTHNKLVLRIYCLIANSIYFIISKIGLPAAPGSMLGIKTKLFNELGGFSENIQFAEDRDLVRRGSKKGYSFRFFLNPKYKMSLRRIEKFGILRYIFSYVVVNIKRELHIRIDSKKDYPMGGK